jgi:hypothetical protein
MYFKLSFHSASSLSSFPFFPSLFPVCILYMDLYLLYNVCILLLFPLYKCCIKPKSRKWFTEIIHSYLNYLQTMAGSFFRFYVSHGNVYGHWYRHLPSSFNVWFLYISLDLDKKVFIVCPMYTQWLHEYLRSATNAFYLRRKPWDD